MSKVSFQNTEVAFASKSNSDLNRSYLLFSIIQKPFLVKAGKSLTQLALQLFLPINGLIKATIYKQFCGGENIDACKKTIHQLADYHIGTILDYSVEGKETEADFNRAALEILETIKLAGNDPKIPFCVFKVTGMARFALLEKVTLAIPLNEWELKEWEIVKNRIDKICGHAAEADKPIFIDAEESWIQGAIDQIAEEMMRKYNQKKAIVYNTFQLYLKDKLTFLKISFHKAEKDNYFLGAKLVRGAYMEKERERAIQLNYPSPVQDTKEATDRDFNEALIFCVEHCDRISICAGTHNEQSSYELMNLMEKHRILPGDERIYFSQLLGMSDHISYNLSAHGYKVAKYVPYGPVKDVLPYLIRRAEENTSVRGQTSRELSLLIKEKDRRKLLQKA